MARRLDGPESAPRGRRAATAPEARAAARSGVRPALRSPRQVARPSRAPSGIQSRLRSQDGLGPRAPDTLALSPTVQTSRTRPALVPVCASRRERPRVGRMPTGHAGSGIRRGTPQSLQPRPRPTRITEVIEQRRVVGKAHHRVASALPPVRTEVAQYRVEVILGQRADRSLHTGMVASPQAAAQTAEADAAILEREPASRSRSPAAHLARRTPKSYGGRLGRPRRSGPSVPVARIG
jgi:hypothetical protein